MMSETRQKPRLSKRLHKIFNGDTKVRSSLFVRWLIIVLVVLNITYVAVEPTGAHTELQMLASVMSYLSMLFFVIEYACRIIAAPHLYYTVSPAKARAKYLVSFFGVVDFIAIIPFLLPLIVVVDSDVLNIVNVARIFLIFKLIRYSTAFDILREVMRQARQELFLTLSIGAIFITFSGMMMYYIEQKAQPEIFYSAGQGFWWAIVTFTTVGYGDIMPVTGLGKRLAGCISLVGVGMLALSTAIISASLLEIMSKQFHTKKK